MGSRGASSKSSSITANLSSRKANLPNNAVAMTVNMAIPQTFYNASNGYVFSTTNLGTTEGGRFKSERTLRKIYESAIKNGVPVTLHSRKEIEEANKKFRNAIG